MSRQVPVVQQGSCRSHQYSLAHRLPGCFQQVPSPTLPEAQPATAAADSDSLMAVHGREQLGSRQNSKKLVSKSSFETHASAPFHSQSLLPPSLGHSSFKTNKPQANQHLDDQPLRVKMTESETSINRNSRSQLCSRAQAAAQSILQIQDPSHNQSQN